jgi:hypothetical protein
MPVAPDAVAVQAFDREPLLKSHFCRPPVTGAVASSSAT